MPYTLADAIRDEITLLEKRSIAERGAKHDLWADIFDNIAKSHKRILDRFEKGIDYEFILHREKDGSLQAETKRTISDRKTLEEEYPALKKLAEQYDIMRGLIDATPDD